MRSHQPKKRFGQNFLIDEYIIEKIVACIHPTATDHLVEIGPGLGAITLPLLRKVAKIAAIELDKDIIPLLKQKALSLGKLEIHQQDALTVDLRPFSSEGDSVRVVGNLPYNISTPLLFHLLAQKQFIKDMHFMLQKEVAERLAALPGTKQYGRLSVMAQYHCTIEKLLHVPPHAFKPAPQVESMFIRLQPINRALLAQDLPTLDLVTKEAFSKRRKTLSNALKKMITKEQLTALNINPLLRPEDLTIDNFVIISNYIHQETEGLVD